MRTIPIRTTIATAVLAAVLAVLAGPPAAAAALAPRAAEIVEPRLDRLTFATFLQTLTMDDDQRMIAEILYGDYATGFDDLCRDVEALAEDAGQSRVDAALAGRIFIEPAELRRIRAAVLAIRSRASDEAQSLLDTLLSDTRSLLTGDDPVLEHGLRPLIRAVHLHPRRADELEHTYAGEGIDVLELFADARAEGGELARVDPGACAAALDAYEEELHRFLVTTAARDRRDRGELAIARVQRDAVGMREMETALLDRWKVLYAIDRRAVDAVAAAAERQAGRAAADAWRYRFQRALFPRLHAESGAEKRHAWIARRTLADGVREQADDVIAAFRREHDVASAEAVALLLRARLSFGAIVHAGLDMTSLTDPAARELCQDLLKNSGRRSRLDADASSELEALLTDGQRRQMKADIAAAAHGRRR